MGLLDTMRGASIASYIAMEVPQTSYFNISSTSMSTCVLSTQLSLQFGLLSLGERDTKGALGFVGHVLDRDSSALEP